LFPSVGRDDHAPAVDDKEAVATVAHDGYQMPELLVGGRWVALLDAFAGEELINEYLIFSVVSGAVQDGVAVGHVVRDVVADLRVGIV
jgi:hypothetical protein